MKQYTKIPVTISSISEEDNSLWAVFSTSDKDRHGDEVQQNWKLDNFMRNPVVLNSHNYSDTADVIGRVEILSQKDNKLEGKIRFAVEENPKAKVTYQLYKGGYLNAFSVGFIPGQDENELLELSAVSVPANALALAKQKGIEVEKLDKKSEEEERAVNTETEVKDPQDEPQEATEPSDDELNKQIDEKTKEIQDMFKKEGRVLSTTNRRKVEQVISLLQALLSADSKTKENKIKETLRALDKVVTRLQQEGDRARTKRKINKVIRELISQKNKL